ncbi:potassium channel subfamily U member 1 [Bubalus kerabau]|uniref:potassium channel subfamily U member 1 n=1 Tax=Bubalus carabanensis TaxID=3119969 RepID=UPI00244EEA0C|nr:potassium channel subfamily U member 1 [Bubalus carabanensis]
MFVTKPKDELEESMEKLSCTTEIQAVFILSSIAIFFCGFLILFISRFIRRNFKKWKKSKGIFLEFNSGNMRHKHSRSLTFQSHFRDRIEMLLSAQTLVGQVLVILVFVLSIGSLIIYFINSTDPVRSCSSYKDRTIPIDLTFNAFFSFYFGLRFLAADDKIKFWLEMNSIVDIFTIPPTFISYYLKSNWLGLRFLRALRLLELPQILQILRAISTSNSVKFCKLLSIVLSTWFTAAGFIHLVENSGDPWLKGRNSQNISFFESIYLIMATMSTVGFGDVVAKTYLGRIFIIVFTLGSLVLFANYLPEMVELLANKRKYTSSYEVVKGKKFIVVCGNITVDSVMAFLRNFLRHKAGEINTEIVFLGEVPPSLELETIFKRHMAYTTFISGSALKWEDLRRVAVDSAEACLIIANPLCSDSHAEDSSNIMRVLSIKNYYPNTRVIIQILQSHNKAFLPKIPSWNWNAGDNIICFAELKLGFIAQGCLVPGLCTFLTSLFVEQNKKICPHEPWQQLFCNGLKNKILTQRLSNDFAGMSFPDACQLCFTKMHLMLIAIEYKSACHGYCGLILNPPAQVKLRKNTLGFFIAESAKDVKRAFFYCAICHSDVQTPELIEKCDCKSKTRRATGTTVVVMRDSQEEYCGPQDPYSETHMSFYSGLSVTTKTFFCETEEESDRLDSSGMFHWCRATPLNKMILKRTDKAKYEFRDHIVACIFGDAHSTLMGLRNFVMPLRASNYTRQELKDIVFVGSLDYLQREWRFIRNFPQIYILPGSALYSVDLHAVNIEECSMCAVLSSSCKSPSSPTLVDTEPIMATLNIRYLRISCSARTPSGPQFARSCSSNPRKSKYRRIPILTELKNPSNIHFIEQLSGMEWNFSGTNLHLSTSFATGTVFSGSFLDSLLATAFYNYHVVELLQMLVTGGMNFQLEQHLDKEKLLGLNTGYSTILPGKMRCKLGLLSLNQTVLSDIEPRKTFGQIFCGSLNNLGILCLGLYRMIDKEECNPEHKREVCWFVITRPENEFSLLPSDLVFCAIPFSTSCYKKDSKASASYEIINIMPLKKETVPDVSPDQTPLVDQAKESVSQLPCRPVPLLEPKPIPATDSKQAILTLGSKHSSHHHCTYPGETVEENGKESMEETTVEDAYAFHH